MASTRRSYNLEKLQLVIEDLEKFFRNEELEIEVKKLLLQKAMEEGDTGNYTVFETYLSGLKADIFPEWLPEPTISEADEGDYR